MANLTLDNPFLVPCAHPSATSAEPRGSEYAIVRREGAAAPDVERLDAEVIEVTVRWGRTVLGVAHVPLDGALSIGEDDRGAILVPESLLGATSFELLARGELRVPTGAKVDGVDASPGRLTVGAAPVRFTLGSVDSGITVQVARVAAARALPRASSLKKGIVGILGASVLAHAALVGALAFSPGASLDDDQSALDKSTMATLIQLQTKASAREQAQDEEIAPATKDSAPGGENGGAHKGPSGQMGSLQAKVTSGAYAVQGPPENKHEQLAHARAMIESKQFGAIGALASVFGAQTGPIDAVNAFEVSLGHDAQTATGNLTGDHVADSFGYDGLGLTGMGPGGNGFTDGIGLGPVGGFGHGPGEGGISSGTCLGGMSCSGSLVSAKGFKRPTGTVHVLDPGSDVEGSLPPEVVRRIVRANFSRLRACYDAGLRSDPGLRGTVKTRFIIDQTGAVETASLAGSTLPDASVSSCVVSVFSTMSFPAPETGKARVVYPVAFDHDD